MGIDWCRKTSMRKTELQFKTGSTSHWLWICMAQTISRKKTYLILIVADMRINLRSFLCPTRHLRTPSKKSPFKCRSCTSSTTTTLYCDNSGSDWNCRSRSPWQGEKQNMCNLLDPIEGKRGKEENMEITKEGRKRK